MTPTSGPTDIPFLITGSGFGAYNGRIINEQRATRVMIGTMSATLSYWADTQIRGIIPEGLPQGVHQVAVEIETDGGVVRSNETGYEPQGIMAAGLTPLSTGGPITFEVLSPEAAAQQGVQTPPIPMTEAALVVSTETGATVMAPDKTSVDVPPEALEEETVITVAESTEEEAPELDREAAAGEEELACHGKPIHFGPEGQQFEKPVTVTIPFNPARVGEFDLDKLKIAYWNKETKAWEPLASTIDITKRTISAQVTHFSVYQVLQPKYSVITVPGPVAAAAEFAFRDAYIFPNPTKGGQRPTIRVQVGLASSVEIRIHDLSGSLVHQTTLHGAKLLDDGNGKGQQYTFDYTWNTSGVGSGVYAVLVIAKKTGHKDITLVKRVAVIK